MKPYVIIQDDCLDVLRALPDNSVDAFCQDPPANISFMGKGWDDFRRAHNVNDAGRDSAFGRASRTSPEVGRTRNRDGGETFIAYLTERFAEEFRVLKPGGHAVTWALPRTSDWTVTALRRAGFSIGLDDFEIRDVVHHLFGSQGLADNFLGSLSPEQLGALERLIESQAPPALVYHLFGSGMNKSPHVLKPAVEHWIAARKPIEGTVVDNVAVWGTGTINVDGCRIAYRDAADRAQAVVPQPDFKQVNGVSTNLDAHARNGEMFDPGTGRWPAHLVLDETTGILLDAQSGPRGAAAPVKGTEPSASTDVTFGKRARVKGAFHADKGGASRFFYQAKAPKSEKTVGGTVENKHPTPKSVELMRWLCRLVTPSDGLVVDPFAGSGSTGVACAAEGFRFLGIERGETGQDTDHEYALTAQRRVAHAYGDSMSDDDDDLDEAMPAIKPFLRWVGGKRKQAVEIAAWCTSKLAPQGRYIEPCLGGGAVALAMPAGTPMILGDACEPLGWLWWWVQQEPEAVAEYAAGFGNKLGEGWNTAEGFAAARVLHNTERFSTTDYTPSARFLWLQQAGFNGLYRENRKGLFNAPWGKRANVGTPTAEHLRAVADHLATAELRPGWDLLDVVAEAHVGDVLYVDPPYDGDVTAFTSYVAKPFGPADQAALAEALVSAVNRGVAVCTTNANTERIRQLYSLGWEVTEVDEARPVAADPTKRKPAACVMIRSR